MEVIVQRDWNREYHQKQAWEKIEIFCPKCGQCSVWTETSMHYEEDNIGSVLICSACTHSFHYSHGTDYIYPYESAQIIKCLRAGAS